MIVLPVGNGFRQKERGISVFNTKFFNAKPQSLAEPAPP